VVYYTYELLTTHWHNEETCCECLQLCAQHSARICKGCDLTGLTGHLPLYAAVIHAYEASCLPLDSTTIITNKHTVASTMSSSTPGQTSTPPSNFKLILDAALSEYKKKTGKQLLDHPIATELQRCGSVDAILAIFRGQAEAFQQFRDGDQRLMKWISPVVDVLYTFSGTFGGVAGIVRPELQSLIT
jgi:hypothetical protein